MPKRMQGRGTTKGPRRSSRGPYGIRRGPRGCKLCQEKMGKAVDYKNVGLLKRFVTEQGKIIPSRISGNCASHQRRVTNAVKKARIMALLTFAAE